MDRLQDDPRIREFLKSVASADDAHGAVAVAAVSGALGTSLLLMVSALPQTRSGSMEDRTRLVGAGVALNDVQEQLLETVQTETAVKIFAARRMPQGSAAERSERQAAIQLALSAAADVPLEVMRLSSHALKQAEVVAAHASRAASADVQFGIALLHAACAGARSNLEGKLSSLTNTQHVRSVVDDIARLSEEATAATRAAEAHLRVPPV
jgi:formiminotetrahydrofolate cyclodeaminase